MKTYPDQNWRGRLSAYAPFILWIGVIFFMSSPQGSMAETSRFIGPLLHFLLPNASEETIVLIHKGIRKLAHFTEYGLLALLAVRAFARSSSLFKFRYLLPPIIAFVIASVDEFNQSFEPARTALFSDVLLDTGSAAVISFLLWLMGWPRKRRDNESVAESSK